MPLAPKREREKKNKQTSNKETKTLRSSTVNKYKKTKLLLKSCSGQGMTQ